MRLRSSQDATPTCTPLRRPARTASNRNSSKLPKRSTLFVCFNNSSSCKKPSFAVLSIMHLLFQTHRSRLSACFPSTIVQRERNRLRGASPTRQPCSTPCTKNRRGENVSWAGDVRRQDPFEGEWEQILFWLVANPERSSGDIFRELKHRSPGRYQPFQIRTLQRGMRKIRTYLLETFEEQWQKEVIHGRSHQSVSSASNPARNS